MTIVNEAIREVSSRSGVSVVKRVCELLNLGECSHLEPMDEYSQRFRDSDYERSETAQYSIPS
jgi:hypothetical protein